MIPRRVDNPFQFLEIDKQSALVSDGATYRKYTIRTASSDMSPQ